MVALNRACEDHPIDVNNLLVIAFPERNHIVEQASKRVNIFLDPDWHHLFDPAAILHLMDKGHG